MHDKHHCRMRWPENANELLCGQEQREPLIGKQVFDNFCSSGCLKVASKQRPGETQGENPGSACLTAASETPSPTPGKLNRISSKFPTLFRDEPGKLKWYIHRIRLKPDKTRLPQAAPSAVRHVKAVNEELQRLKKQSSVSHMEARGGSKPVPVPSESASIWKNWNRTLSWIDTVCQWSSRYGGGKSWGVQQDGPEKCFIELSWIRNCGTSLRSLR